MRFASLAQLGAHATAIMVAAAALALAAASFLAFIRYKLRPRHAQFDPAATGLPVEAVVIPSASGARLAGWFLPAAGRGAVLLLHGVKSNRLVLVDRMRFLREAAYSTLAIDFQAHGESTGGVPYTKPRLTYSKIRATPPLFNLNTAVHL